VRSLDYLNIYTLQHPRIELNVVFRWHFVVVCPGITNPKVQGGQLGLWATAGIGPYLYGGLAPRSKHRYQRYR